MNLKVTFLAWAIILTGCASATPQAESVLVETRGLPKFAEVEKVPFIEQAAHQCGPATLAMAMNWAGKNISVDEIVPMVYTPGMKGSFQADMVSASRRQGFLAIPIEGLPSLLKEVSAGNPVIVFENLALSWLPQWHYAIVFGYDLQRQQVLMHSGPESFKRWDLRKFERSWKLGGYWGLVVLPAGRLSASAGELSHVKAAAALEQIGKLDEARLSYQLILERWAQSLPAQIGIGNIAYSKKDYPAAIDILQQASLAHPSVAVVWHNLAIAQGAAKMKTAARHTALQALMLAAPEEKALYEKNLKEWTSDPKM